jgi:hypothetical protein
MSTTQALRFATSGSLAYGLGTNGMIPGQVGDDPGRKVPHVRRQATVLG